MTRFFALAVLSLPLFAELTPAQRESDFRNMAHTFAKSYGPMDWKRQALRFDGLDVAPWLTRIRAAKDDLEFFEICAEYVAAYQDGHLTFAMPSNFTADLGIRIDLYDGKPLIEGVSRALYPAARFPLLNLGAEVVSIGGEPIGDLINRLARIQSVGSGRAALRYAAQSAVFRPQALFPNAANLPDQTEVIIRAANGEEATYTLIWTKSGRPVREIVTPDSPRLLPSSLAAEAQEGLRPDLKLQIPESRVTFLNNRIPDGQTIIGWGQRNPYYALPANFNLRRGRFPTDTFITGTYESEGFRLGLIRIPNFSPTAGNAAALRELDEEIAFLRANTDGLIVDVTRNNGGDAGLVSSYMARLATGPYFYTGFQALPTTRDVLNYAQIAELAAVLKPEPWVRQTWLWLAQSLNDAYQLGGRNLSGPLPLFPPADSNILTQAPLIEGNFPAAVRYDKPVVMLADDLSVSGGDLLPAIFQDNRRGPVIGVRTGGLGANVVQTTSAMPFSEGFFSVSRNLMFRRQPVQAPDLPLSNYVENVGVIPDVQIDSMTTANLLDGYRTFIAEVTRAAVAHIRATAGR
jgi:hypothetical protein